MNVYTGVDVIEIDRFEKALARWGKRFFQRIYTDNEIVEYREQPASLAVRFAAKEAVMKLLGRGQDRIGWREIEVLPGEGGRPQVNLYGRAAAAAEELNLGNIAISLSHSKTVAIASATAIGD